MLRPNQKWEDAYLWLLTVLRLGGAGHAAAAVEAGGLPEWLPYFGASPKIEGVSDCHGESKSVTECCLWLPCAWLEELDGGRVSDGKQTYHHHDITITKHKRQILARTHSIKSYGISSPERRHGIHSEGQSGRRFGPDVK